MYEGYMNSPIGILHICADEEGIIGLYFVEEAGKAHENAYIHKCKKQLCEYFAGKRKKFSVPLHIVNGTPFQRLCWDALCKIPYGQTRSYFDQAVAIGNPKAVRAVGGANHRNPISILIPCHRVIAKNGSLCGYGGGVIRKEYLLQLETGDEE